VLDRLRPRLEVVGITGRPGARAARELFDLPDAPRPAADVPAPVRLLPEYDDLLLGHADRSRVVTDDDRRRMWRVNGAVPGALLVDGTVAGSWTVRRSGARGGTATLVLTPFRDVGRRARAEATAEAERLVRVTADDATGHAVGWADDDPGPGALRSVP
jgi:Winged helix DNA-binding domain